MVLSVRTPRRAGHREVHEEHAGLPQVPNHRRVARWSQRRGECRITGGNEKSSHRCALQKERFDAHDKLENRKLLWHGTNVAVVVAILKSGLRIMPHSGGRVGKGIYFASENGKSSGYGQFTRASPIDRTPARSSRHYARSRQIDWHHVLGE